MVFNGSVITLTSEQMLHYGRHVWPVAMEGMYLVPPLRGFPFELGNCTWAQKTRLMELPG